MARVQEQNASLSSAVYSNKQPEVTDDELQRMLKTNGPPISPEAQIIIEDAATGYAEDLVLEAARLARRENLQQIGTAHVKEAQKRLLSIDRRNWTKRLCGSTGGVLLGIGAAPFISLWAGTATPVSLVVAGGICLVLGSFLLMFGVRE